MRGFSIVLLLAAMPPALAVAPPAPAPYREGEVVVRYRAAAAPVAKIKADLGLRAKRSLLGGRGELLELPHYLRTRDALDLLRADPAVAYAEPNFLRYARRRTPDDPLFGEQWGLHSTGQLNFGTPDPALASIPGADMDLLRAWDADGDGVFERTGDGAVTVAVIDDAISTTHVDLAPNMVAGYNAINGSADPNPANAAETHGTLVAGCVAAVGDNGIGVAGAAWNVRLMPIKFGLDSASHVRALEFARNNGADIVNASFGGPGFSQLELEAIRELGEAGILYVAAAGNDDSNTDLAQLNYPANYDAPNIIAVAATNRQDQIASFSQYGAITTDVAAPGLQIVTTAADPLFATNPGVNGTSFAAPYTAGVAALIKSHVTPQPSAAEIKARLIEGAESGDGASLRTVAGRVNAAESLELAPRPALAIRSIALDGNGALDPGETAVLSVTLENLWQHAFGVSAALSADQGLGTGGPAHYGDIPAGGFANTTFAVTVPADIADHRYVAFTLAVTAEGGYSAQRRFQLEVGRLPIAETALTQSFAGFEQDLYDEFHAWHFDLTALPAGHDQLVIETTTASDADSDGTRDDIDLLLKRGQPPRYNITVGVNPEAPGFFCTSGVTGDCQDPAGRISAGPDGDERIVIDHPQPGTYHLVVVNFAQLDTPLAYTLRAYTQAAAAPGTRSGVGGGDGGGGAWSLWSMLLLSAALRRRAACA